MIARFEIFHFRHTLHTPVPTVMGPLRHRPALLLRLEDTEGAHGWGEIWCNFPPDGDLHRARLAANVLPAVLADMKADTVRPFAAVLGKLRRLAIQAGEPGPVAQIACAVDIALHDMRARRGGVPLATLLGGAPRPLPAYASGISPADSPAQIERMRALGYTRFKQRIGFGRDNSIPEAEATAANLSPDETLMLDANQAWTLEQAIEHCARLSRLAPIWLEEPLCADAPLADWQALAAATDIPLAAGENLTSEAAFQDAILGGAIGFLQPDVCKWGGLSTTADIARAANERGLTYCPHFLGGGVGLIASAHLLAAIGGDGVLEVDSSENPLLDVLSGAGLALKQGLFDVPDAPGLGYDPDIAAVRDMRHAHHEGQV